MYNLVLAACLLQSSYPAEKAEDKDDGVVLSDYSSCGVTSLYLACRMRDVAVEFDKLRELVGPPDADGTHSFSDLSGAARQLGLTPLPLEVDRSALATLPMPVIAQLNRSAYSESLPHFVLVLKCEGDGVIVLDAPYRPRLVLDERFAQLWTGRVLAFARDEEEAEAIASQAKVRRAWGIVAWAWAGGGAALIALLLSAQWLRAPAAARAPTVAPASTSRGWARPTLVKVAGFVILACAVAWFAAPSRPAGARCVLEKAQLKLGELGPGQHSVTVPIHNPGTEPLVIEEVDTTCTCATVTKPGAIAPAGRSELKVKLDVAAASGGVRLLLNSNDPTGPKNLLISWTGVVTPILSRRYVDAGPVPCDRPYESTLRVSYPGGKRAVVPHLKSFVSPSKLVQAKEGRNDPEASKSLASRKFVGPLGQMDLHLSVAAPGTPKIFKEFCKLTLSHGNTTTEYEIPIHVEFAPGPITPDVPRVFFSAAGGVELVGSERVIGLKHGPLGNSKMTVRGVPPWLRADLIGSSDGDSALRLTITSPPPGPRRTQVVHVDCAGSLTATVPIPVDVLVGRE